MNTVNEFACSDGRAGIALPDGRVIYLRKQAKMVTAIDFDESDDLPAQSFIGICYDCGKEEQIYNYILLEDGLAGLCYEHWWKRRRAAQQRAGEAESTKA